MDQDSLKVIAEALKDLQSASIYRDLLSGVIGAIIAAVAALVATKLVPGIRVE